MKAPKIASQIKRFVHLFCGSISRRYSGLHFQTGSKTHHEQPDLSFRAYRARRRLALGKTVAQKTRIYLDTRYWIHVRDARLGRPKKPEHDQIYQLLHKLV